MWKHRGVRHQLLLSVHPVMTAASIGFVRERIYACRLFRARLLSISRTLLLLFLVVLWHHLGYLRLVVKSIFAIFCPKPSPIQWTMQPPPWIRLSWINLMHSLKYCIRFWFEESDAGIQRYFMSSSTGLALLQIDRMCVIPFLARLSLSWESLIFPR